MPTFIIKNIHNMKGLFLERQVQEGEVIYTLDGPTLLTPTQTSIKISDFIHVEDKYGQFINHNCHPSVRVYDAEIIALRDLKAGEEITFNYLENEDELVAPFTCQCCGKLIS